MSDSRSLVPLACGTAACVHGSTPAPPRNTVLPKARWSSSGAARPTGPESWRSSSSSPAGPTRSSSSSRPPAATAGAMERCRTTRRRASFSGWIRRGVKNVKMLHTADPKVADTEAFAKDLRDAECRVVQRRPTVEHRRLLREHTDLSRVPQGARARRE